MPLCGTPFYLRFYTQSMGRCTLSARSVTAVRSRLLILLALPTCRTADSGCVMKNL